LAANPPLRAIWVTAGNPVTMLPDSAKVARAFEQTEFSVVVDSFPTDTTRRATLVLPTTTLLEDDDLLGAYGHHYLAVSRPVVKPPEGVLTDLEILQELGKRLGLEHEVQRSAREWKKKMLAQVADRGASIEALERGPVKNPLARDVVFNEKRVPTESGRVNLIHELPPVPEDSAEDRARFPLHLLSNSTEKSQSSQWSIETTGAITATLHPDAARGIAHGANARLVSAIGSLLVRVIHDATQRRDVVVVPKGGHFDHGWAVNALIRARETDHGQGAAYLNTRVRIEPEIAPENAT
jgi:anaerobic selenocysteine-containing dehydrogenase